MTLLQHILGKVSSGRWLCTVAVSFAFVWLVVTGQMDPKDAQTIITAVVVFYFTKSPETEAKP